MAYRNDPRYKKAQQAVKEVLDIELLQWVAQHMQDDDIDILQGYDDKIGVARNKLTNAVQAIAGHAQISQDIRDYMDGELYLGKFELGDIWNRLSNSSKQLVRSILNQNGGKRRRCRRTRSNSRRLRGGRRRSRTSNKKRSYKRRCSHKRCYRKRRCSLRRRRRR